MREALILQVAGRQSQADGYRIRRLLVMKLSEVHELRLRLLLLRLQRIQVHKRRCVVGGNRSFSSSLAWVGASSIVEQSVGLIEMSSWVCLRRVLTPFLYVPVKEEDIGRVLSLNGH